MFFRCFVIAWLLTPKRPAIDFCVNQSVRSRKTAFTRTSPSWLENSTTGNSSAFIDLFLIISNLAIIPWGKRDKPFCTCRYRICCPCVHAMPCLRRRGGNGERRNRAHGVARSHWRILYHIRRDEITVRTKSNCRGKCRGASTLFNLHTHVTVKIF